MQPVRHPRDGAVAAADELDRTGVLLLKEAIPVREAIALSASAVDCFLWRKAVPEAPGAILCTRPDAVPGAEIELDLSLLKAVCLGTAGDVARAYFRRRRGVEAFLVPLKALVVRVFGATANPPRALPCHQDAHAFPHTFEMVNSWTLLYPGRTCADAAGLKLIPAGVSEFIELDANPAHPTKSWMESSHTRVQALADRRGTWVPEVELGDAVLFNMQALHRTHHGTPRRFPRLAAEVRMFALEPMVAETCAQNGQPFMTVRDGRIEGPTRARISEKAVEFLP
jgi:hypothetical protein